MLTTQETAQHLGICTRRVRALIYEGRLPAVKYGRDWLIDPAHLSLVKDRRPGCPPGTKRATATSYSKPTPLMKRYIRERDGEQCQYCGTTDKDIGYVVGHILYNGVAQPYNLVMVCRPCNTRQGKALWLPRNFYEITNDHLHWRMMLLELAARDGSQQHVS